MESIIRAYLVTVDCGLRRKLLEEIGSCARLHVERFDHSLSPRGLLQAMRKKIALRRVQRTIVRLKADLTADDRPGGRLP